ncbi:MAG: hypothetical protein P8X86_02330 [Desulfofustis sp.]
MWNIPSRERLDRLPRLHATESTPLHNKLVYLHFLIGDSDWYVCEFDGDDLFFSYAILNGDMDNAEWGYISFRALQDISINGIEVDCEREGLCSPKSVSEIPRIMQGRVVDSKPICKLVGEDGNVFNLIAIVRQTLKKHHLYQQLQDFDQDLRVIQWSGGSYNEVLTLFMEYVEVV